MPDFRSFPDDEKRQGRIKEDRNMQRLGTLTATTEEDHMIKKSLIVVAAVLFAASAFAQSGTSPGSSGNAPGQKMQNDTTSKGPGASEYAPGHKMQNAKKSTAPGASEYAPGHQTTTGSSRTKK
jgi:hypothetical protein